jgi:hypothetical protein
MSKKGGKNEWLKSIPSHTHTYTHKREETEREKAVKNIFLRLFDYIIVHPHRSELPKRAITLIRVGGERSKEKIIVLGRDECDIHKLTHSYHRERNVLCFVLKKVVESLMKN